MGNCIVVCERPVMPPPDEVIKWPLVLIGLSLVLGPSVSSFIFEFKLDQS